MRDDGFSYFSSSKSVTNSTLSLFLPQTRHQNQMKPSQDELLIECIEHSSTAPNPEFSIPATSPLNFAHCTIRLPSVLLRDSENRTGSRHQYIIWHLRKVGGSDMRTWREFFSLFWARSMSERKVQRSEWPRKFECLLFNARLLGVKWDSLSAGMSKFSGDRLALEFMALGNLLTINLSIFSPAND